MLLSYAFGFLVLVGFFLAGDGLHRIGVPIPSGVLGLLLFLLALQLKWIKLKWVERASGLMLRHMVLFFVPLTVGLMEMGKLLSAHLVPIVASLVVSWAAVVVSTGLLGRWLMPISDFSRPDDAESEDELNISLNRSKERP